MSLLLHAISGALARVGTIGGHIFFDPLSGFSLASLACAMVVATLVVGVGRWRRRGRLSLRLMMRALRPRRAAVRGASGRTDVGFFLFNAFAGGVLIGWALLSQTQAAAWTREALVALGGPAPLHITGMLPTALTGVALYLASELAYWVDHWLSHRVPALWEIHKVHHTAEALTPLTTFRVHPLESLKFYNITAIFTGVAAGMLQYGLGASQLSVISADVLFVAFTFTVGHLHHSHVWISFRGGLEKLLMSPAAHQIHHSSDPRHFGRNLGNSLALWDWLFGTLYAPAAKRERLVFGVPGEGEAAHTVTGAMLTPVAKALSLLTRAAGEVAAEGRRRGRKAAGAKPAV
ncbi:MAG TPA: sterol desaturase family protein [Caulobacteraceae bacterium]|nr:sterol desaturase family protein [Caulobacteraceae bacterium]